MGCLSGDRVTFACTPGENGALCGGASTRVRSIDIVKELLAFCCFSGSAEVEALLFLGLLCGVVASD